MKSLFLLLVVATIATAAPTYPEKDIRLAGELSKIPIKRDQRAATFGHSAEQPIVIVPSSGHHHGHHLGFGHGGHHLGAHRPFVGHHSHIFRGSDDNDVEEKFEKSSELLKAAEVKEGKINLNSNLEKAREAVENLERDLKEIEGESKTHKQWTKTDMRSDDSLHKNIENARAALADARKNFDDLESAKTNSGVVVTQLRQEEDEARMAQWKEHIHNIQGKHTEENMKSKINKDSMKMSDKLHEMETSASNSMKSLSKSVSEDRNEDIHASTMTDSHWNQESHNSNMMSSAQLARESSSQTVTKEQSKTSAKEETLEKAMRSENDKINNLHKKQQAVFDSHLEQRTELESNSNNKFMSQQKNINSQAQTQRQGAIITDASLSMKSAEEHAKFNSKHHLHVPSQVSEMHGKSTVHDMASSSSMKHGVKVHDGMTGKSAELEFGKHSVDMQMRDPLMRSMIESNSDWKSLYAGENARSAYGGYGAGYGAASGIGAGASVGAAAGAAAGGSGGGVIGVFPGANIGQCGLPILLSCSPSVVQGSLRSHSYAAAPAAYGASGYRSAGDLKKRDTKKYAQTKAIKKRADTDFAIPSQSRTRPIRSN